QRSDSKTTEEPTWRTREQENRRGKVQPGEDESRWTSQRKIKKLMSNRANFSKCGPFIAGKKCMMLRDDLDEEKMYTLQLRTSTDAEGNNYSVCVGKTLSGKKPPPPPKSSP
uniref:Uncharacterized protein n=1 Tax=Scophthalmus maximus TaxID=52904 RepID=A0A8D2ZW48_SCOMX